MMIKEIILIRFFAIMPLASFFENYEVKISLIIFQLFMFFLMFNKKYYR